MANEFKVRKGLIVEGSGSAVLDIQGSQGQLFSITDDLTGDIFSVSDISGVPILNVNAGGTTTIDGAVSSSADGIRSEGTIRSAGAVMGMESILSRDITVGRNLQFAATPTAGTGTKALMFISNGSPLEYRTLGSNAFNSNTYNNYSLPSATAEVRGGVKIGYEENGKNYPVELAEEQMYVNVPWTDNNTTYSVGDGGLTKKNFTTTLKTKLDGIAGSANNYGFYLSVDSGEATEVSSGATLNFRAGSNIRVDKDSNSITITSTNTTYSADGNYGMTLSGTAFRLENDRRRNSTTVDIYTGNTHDYVFFDASHGMRFYTSGAEEMRLEDDGDLHVDGDVIAFSSTVSDERLKDNVTTIENPLDKIKALRGVEYDWNDGSRKGKHDLGLIAQEVEKVIPNIVHEHQMPLLNDDEEDETLYKTVDYEKLTAVLIEGMKEQQNQIDSLKSELAKIKGSL